MKGREEGWRGEEGGGGGGERGEKKGGGGGGGVKGGKRKGVGRRERKGEKETEIEFIHIH